MYFLGIIIASIFGYLFGSISFSIIVVKLKKGVDVRTIGSKNAGATNTTRALGKFWGFVVVVLDALKVVITAGVAICLSMIPSPLFSQTSYFIPLIFVLIGHCWPIWYGFKGGKAVACFLGLLFVANIWYLLIFLFLWFVTVAISKRVSVASIVAAVVVGGIVIWLPWLNGLNTFTYSWNSWDKGWCDTWQTWQKFSWANYLHCHTAKISGQPNFADSMLEINIIIFLGMGILALRHFPNIKRIKNHEEPETFPKKTPEEKQAYKEYIKQPKQKKNKKARE